MREVREGREVRGPSRGSHGWGIGSGTGSPTRDGGTGSPPVLPTVLGADSCQIPPVPPMVPSPLSPRPRAPWHLGPLWPPASTLCPAADGPQPRLPADFPHRPPPSPAQPPLRQEGASPLFSRHVACTDSVWISYLLPLQGIGFRDRQGVCVHLTPILSI